MRSLPGILVRDTTREEQLAKHFDTLSLCLHKDNPYYENQSITPESAMNAEKILLALPPEEEIPRIGIDDDQVMMHWDDANRFILLVDGSQVHCVKRATTPEATYHENLSMSNDFEIIMRLISSRHDGN